MAGLPGYLGKVAVAAGTIGEMMNWAVSGMEREMLEDTVFEDTVKSYVPARIDGGTITVSGQYAPADPGQVQLMADFVSGDAVSAPKFYYADGVDDYFESSAGAVYVESITDFGVDESGLGTIGFVLRNSGGYLEKHS